MSKDINQFSGSDATASGNNIVTDNSKFAIIEGYKIARTNLMFSLAAKNSKFVAVTSWEKGVGKSTVTSNLAISFAKAEKRVLLVDCDLRRPNIHNLLKVDNDLGFSQVLSRMTSFREAVHRDVLPYLDVVTSGSIPPNPSELLCSTVLPDLVKEWEAEYDYIIFDTPPIGIVADAMILKDYVAGYVVVVRERVTTHGNLQRAIRNIKLAKSHVLGLVKVGCSPKRGGFSKSYYTYDRYY